MTTFFMRVREFRISISLSKLLVMEISPIPVREPNGFLAELYPLRLLSSLINTDALI